MSDNDKRVTFSFRARLVLTMAVLLLGSFAMVQYLNQRAQHEVRDALYQQKVSVDNTFFQHVTDITQATSFALTSTTNSQACFSDSYAARQRPAASRSGLTRRASSSGGSLQRCC